MVRAFPNLLITGTPGTGKTTLCEHLAELFPQREDGRPGFQHLKIGQIILDHHLYSEWDDALNVPIFDDEKLLDHLECQFEKSRNGGLLIDFHSGEIFPSEWFDLIVVLQTKTDVLFDRLQQRGYSEAKIKENIESEIFRVVADQVKEVFEGQVEIWEVPNNSMEDQNQLISRLETVLHLI